MSETPGAADHPFGEPLDPALLREPASPPSRPLPAGLLIAVAIPAASMAAAALLQKLLEGPLPTGDAAGRWLQLASLCGLPLGIAIGWARAKTLPRRLLWVAWSGFAPVFFVGLTVGLVRAAHPVREAIAARAARRCRETRKVCSAGEFRQACAAGGSGARAKERVQELLGAPAQSLCDGAGGCVHRWSYAGPWTPDDWVAPGSMLCSVVVDAQGSGQRAAIGPGNEVP